MTKIKAWFPNKSTSVLNTKMAMVFILPTGHGNMSLVTSSSTIDIGNQYCILFGSKGTGTNVAAYSYKGPLGVLSSASAVIANITNITNGIAVLIYEIG